MTSFVTGASGFIGARVCEILARESSAGDVTCLIRNPEQAREFEERGFRVIGADLLDLDAYREALVASERVFHIGALAAMGDGPAYERNNVDATRQIVDALRDAAALKAFVFTSTIGAVDRTPLDPCDGPLTAETEPCPQSDYGRSKLRCEELIRRSDLPWVIVRPSWVYGPGMRAQSHISTFIHAVLNGKLFTQFSFPGRVSVIHVQDLARALAHVGGGEHTHRVLFASDGHDRALGEILEMIARAAKQERDLIHFPGWVQRGFRRIRRFLPFKAQNLFSDVLICTGRDLVEAGCPPERSFETGLLETFEFFAAWRGGRYLVTGAGGGIGAAIAERLHAQGRRLYLVDRDTQALQAMVEKTGAEVLAVDLSKSNAAQRIKEWTDGYGEPVCGLVNNAGVGFRGELQSQSPDLIARTMRVNVEVLMSLTNLYLPEMERYGHGRILNIASSTAGMPLPGMAVYGASKSAVQDFTEAVWAETQGTGVSITCLCPSGTRTNFQASAGVKVLNDGQGLADPDRVATRGVRAMQRGRLTVVLGLQSVLLRFVTHLLPSKCRARLWKFLVQKLR